MKSGDLLFFHGTSWYSYLLEWAGRSAMSHVGMYLYDPPIPIPVANESPTKTYVLHSGFGRSAETGEDVFGVHIEPIERVLAAYADHAVFVRSFPAAPDEEWSQTFVKMHASIHAKPYDVDMRDWWWAALRSVGVPENVERTDRFWCSALVAYLCVGFGWLDGENLPWSLVTPGELANDSPRSAMKWKVIPGPLVPFPKN